MIEMIVAIMKRIGKISSTICVQPFKSMYGKSTFRYVPPILLSCHEATVFLKRMANHDVGVNNALTANSHFIAIKIREIIICRNQRI